MVKLIGPLQSFEAWGSLKDNIVFSRRKSGSQVRYQRKQKDRITSARTAQRDKFSQATEMWSLNDFGKIQFGFNLAGGRVVDISSLPIEKRAPQFARFVSDVLNFYA